MRRAAGVLSIFAILAWGCGTSKVSTPAIQVHLDHPIHTLALAPTGGLLADAIGVELFNRGFQVLDTTSTANLLIRLNLSEVEILNPVKLSLLKEQGIDAYLSVRSAAGRDGLPQSASARLNSTHTGKIVVGVSWQNGWGGQEGSIADRFMRKDLNEAAEEIAGVLAKRIRGSK